MYLDPSSKIGNLSALAVRDCLRQVDDREVGSQFFRQHLKISKASATKLIDELLGRGLLEQVAHGGSREVWYQLTLAGRSLRLASGARPITRASADRKLQEFLARVDSVNRGAYYLHRVRRVLVFGSYLSDSPKLSDVDVAVELEPRFKDREMQFARERERTKLAESTGRRFGNLSQYLC